MVTIKEVAELAGVSIATVSRTLSRPEKVAESTRERVMEAVRQSDYVTNVMASNLRRRHSQTIIVLVPDIANPFYSTIIQALESVAREHGYQILLGETYQSHDMEFSYGELAQRRIAAGVISLGMHIPFEHSPRRKTPDPRWPPLVMACEYRGPIAVPTVAIDNRQAMTDAANHLLRLGHRDIAFINGPEDFSLCGERLAGFRTAMNGAGQRPRAGRILHGAFSLEAGYEAAHRLLSGKSRPTALCCASDELAFGAISAAGALGLAIPSDLSVVGFDDIDFAAYCNPPLTTIHQPTREIGRRAMELMLQRLGGENLAQNSVVLPHELLIRASTQGPAELK